MKLRYGKKHVARMVEAIDQDHATAEDAALAALEAAEEVLQERAAFVVVGQLSGNRERLTIPPSDPEAIKVALGYYSTEGDAQKAAESLWRSTSTGDEFRVWVLPMFYGTPAELHSQQKQKYADAETKRQEKATERLRKQIEAHRMAMEERAIASREPVQV